MSDNNELIEEKIGNVAELQAKYSLMLNKLNQVIISVFEVVNQYGSSFSFNENKHFSAKVALDNKISLLKEICQDIDNMQNYSSSSPIELNIVPIISQANIGRFHNFSSQLGDSNPEWYIGFNETEALLNFISVWHEKKLALRENVEIVKMSNTNDQHKDLLIAHAKWQCFAPIADYISQAMAHYSEDFELNAEEDQYTNNIINNAITNCIDIFPVFSSIDEVITQVILDATELSIPLDYNIATIGLPLALQNFTTTMDAMGKDCNLTLSNEEYQTLNLANVDCLLNWEIY